MQRTLKRELKVLEIVKSEAIEAPKIKKSKDFHPDRNSACMDGSQGSTQLWGRGGILWGLGRVFGSCSPSKGVASIKCFIWDLYAGLAFGFVHTGALSFHLWVCQHQFLSTKLGRSKPAGTFK